MKKICFCFSLLMFALLLSIGPGMSIPAQAGPNPVVIFETSMGRFIIMLYPKDAPKTVKNFLRYVDEGFYNGTVFHRVVREEDFERQITARKEYPYAMIQGGGLTPDLKKKDTYSPVVNESATGLLNKKGTIAMARGGHPNSATAQFFINTIDNAAFDYKQTAKKYNQKEFNTRQGYCAFGKVIRGMKVVEDIGMVKRKKVGRHKNVPVKPVVILKAYRAK